MASSSTVPDGVVIPIRDSQGAECVHVLPEDLPDEPESAEFDAMLEILQAEVAPPGVWANLAEAYYRKGKVDVFRRLLKLLLEGVASPGVREQMEGPTAEGQHAFQEGVLRVLNMLGAEVTLEGIRAKNKGEAHSQMAAWEKANVLLQEAEQFLERERRVQPSVSTLLNTGWMILHLAASEWERGAYYFENAIKEDDEQNKRHCLQAVLGLGIYAFHKKTPDELRKARRHFGEVIRKYPGCPAEVRVGFGLCCYKLGEMERAKAAFQRALALSPGNRTALLALARAELADAEPAAYVATLERVVKMETAAYVQEPKDPVALLALATYYLHKWFLLPADALDVVDGSKTVTVGPSETAGERKVNFDRGDLIRIGAAFTARILEVEEDDDSASITLTLDRHFHDRGAMADGANEGGHHSRLPLYHKSYKDAITLCENCLNLPDEVLTKETRAEALYLRARVVHLLDDFDTAKTFYEKACEACPELAPAQYGLAQMLAAQSRTLTLKEKTQEAAQRLQEAVQALNRVLDKVPNDPEALTLLGLLLAEQHHGTPDKTEALEKLRRAVDLRPDVKETWVALGQVHQREPGADLKEALRCQLEAEKLMVGQREPVPAALLSNIGALFHVKGEQATARQYYRRALEAFATTGGTGLGDLEAEYLSEEQSILHPSNAVFWKWEDVPGMTVSPSLGTKAAAVVENGPEGLTSLLPGEHVRLKLGPGPRDAFVTEVGEDDDASGNLSLKHTFFLPAPADPVQIAKKASRGLLRQETLTTVFNLGMVHQETGEFAAAQELFVAITKQYPSYVAAYVKLGLLAQAQGRGKEAMVWLSKARQIAPEDKDVAAICGKMEQDAGHRDQAQKVFEPLNKEGDPYAMVALGNLYFMNSITVPDKAHHIVHARTYHTKVLKREPKNLYAAHGLGLVLAEEFGKVDDARAVLQAVRERSGDKPDEILINIAHLFVAQGQRNAAIHCYETFLKKRPPTSDGMHVRVLEFVAHAHFLEKAWEQGIRCMLKVFHLEPTKAALACNLGMILKESSQETFRRVNMKTTESVEESRRAEGDLLMAINIFARPELAPVYPKIKRLETELKDQVNRARQYVKMEEKRFREDEDHKAQQAAQVAAELEKREAIKRLEEEQREKEREAARQAALQQEEKLRGLTSQWAQEPKEAPKAKKGGKKSDGEILSEGEESEVEEPEAGKGGSDDEDEEARPLPPPKLASSSEGEDSSSDESSDDEAYGMRPAKPSKDRSKLGGEGGDTTSMELDDDASRKRKPQGGEGEREEGGGGAMAVGPKKRRLHRAQSDDSDSDADELFGTSSSSTTPAVAAAVAAPPPPPAPEVVAVPMESSAAPLPAPPAAPSSPAPPAPTTGGEGEGGGGGGGEPLAPSPAAARRKIVADDDEDEDDE